MIQAKNMILDIKTGIEQSGNRHVKAYDLQGHIVAESEYNEVKKQYEKGYIYYQRPKGCSKMRVEEHAPRQNTGCGACL